MHLSVVEIHLIEGKGGFLEDLDFLEKRKAFKSDLIDVLKNSPSKDRKLLRWHLTQVHLEPATYCYTREVVEDEEFEVLPESSL